MSKSLKTYTFYNTYIKCITYFTGAIITVVKTYREIWFKKNPVYQRIGL